MTLLRRVLGDTLRGRRLRQRRTLREVSGSARVSLGYLSEVERGQKEASSELLAAICEALDVKLSDLLREVSETMRRSERAAEVRRVPGRVILPAPSRRPVPAGVGGPGGRGPLPAGVGGPPPADGLEEDFDAEAFPEAFEDDFRAEPDAEPAVLADSVRTEDGGAGRAAARSTGGATGQPAGLPVGPSVEGAGLDGDLDAGLDGVDLADLETGDGLGDLEALLSLTELTTSPRCLAAA